MDELDLMQYFISEDFLKKIEEEEKKLKEENRHVEDNEAVDNNCSNDEGCLMCGG